MNGIFHVSIKTFDIDPIDLTHFSDNIIVRMPTVRAKNDPIDLSFIWFSHPSINHRVFLTLNNLSHLASISDRSNMTDMKYYEGSELPEFSDVKIFIDSLLMSYQTDRYITFEIERNPMRCTTYHRDFMFGKKI
jgi:hypothetical protein